MGVDVTLRFKQSMTREDIPLCSEIRVLKGREVSPIYVSLHCGHILIYDITGYKGGHTIFIIEKY